MSRAYYNEIDPYCVEWLKNLIAEGHIAPGDVDNRSIEDVTPNDIAGYNQWHFYAGIGAWSYSLRAAGFPDSREVATFSEPCQPFSTAGKRKGFADERYLRPATHHHLSHILPECCFAEQVGSKDGCAWLDVVLADMEGLGYATGSVIAPAAGFGAPHIRQRLYIGAKFMGDNNNNNNNNNNKRSQGHAGHDGATGRAGSFGSVAAPGLSVGLVYTPYSGHERGSGRDESGAQFEACSGRQTQGGGRTDFADAGEVGGSRGMADSDGRNAGAARQQRSGEHGFLKADDFIGIGMEFPARSGAEGKARDEARVRGFEPGCGLGGVDNAQRIGRGAGRQGSDGGYDRFVSHADGGDERMAHPELSGTARLDNISRPATGAEGGLRHVVGGCGRDGLLADAINGQLQEPGWRSGGRNGSAATDAEFELPGPTNGFWRIADWLFCRDGKWRPVEGGTFPLSTGATNRVGQLRAYGNSLCAPQAIEFIKAFLEVENGFRYI